MILRKPYAFFIKMFKPIHIVLGVFVAYLIYSQNRISNFLNTYIHSNTDVVGQNIREMLVNKGLYIIPIVVMISSAIILGIMFKKKKTITFYLLNIFLSVVILVINIYAVNFLGILENTIVSIKNVKLIHDLVFLNIIIESVIFIFFVSRGMGLNIKKFNFDSDLSKIDISDSDKEEFELDISVDLDESRRKRRRKLRYLKYAYIEKKFLINSIIVVSICVISLVIFGTISIYNKKNKEGVVYSLNTFSVGVDNSYILNTNYTGKKITDNYLIVVNAKMKSNYQNNEIYLKDFSLKIGDAIFKPITKYSEDLSDLGIYYFDSGLSLEHSNYLFVYEIPEKYKNSEMLFNYHGSNNNLSILLKPKEISDADVSNSIIKNINNEIEFEGLFKGIKFKINSYELKNNYLIKYNYCVKKNDCVISYEYLKGSIDENFDKYVLRLNVEYSNESKMNINNFYNLLNKFGDIEYKIGDKWYTQSSNFEEIISTKKKEENIEYIGVNSDIKDATNIKIVFNIRGSKYEYVIK